MNIVANCAGRLDTILSQSLSKSRNALSDLIRSGAVSVNGKSTTKPSHKVQIADEIYIVLPAIKTPDFVADVDFDVEVLYEDSSFLVVNKPSDLVVHPASSHKGATLVDWLQHNKYSLSTISGELRNGIVHRLDKETTGGLIVAKTDTSHTKIAAQLENRSLGRYYLAVIDLPLKEDQIIDKPIARNRAKRTKMGIDRAGKEAKTAFVKLAQLGNLELIAAKLFTGRTHQIRVHLSSINRHIVGDELYGYKPSKDKIDGFFLHAFRLDLIHPETDKQISFTAPLPRHFMKLLQNYYEKEKIDEIIDNIERRFDTSFGVR